MRFLPFDGGDRRAGACWAVGSASLARPICRRRCKTWEESKLYILQPFEKRGEMDQGICASPGTQPDARRQGISCSAIADRRRRSASCSACRRR